MMQRLSLPQCTVSRTINRSQRRNLIVRAEEQPPLPPVDPQEKATKGSTSQVRDRDLVWQTPLHCHVLPCSTVEDCLSSIKHV